VACGPCHDINVLRGVDLALGPGEVVGLVGENGSVWALFVVVPVVFIWTADAVTPREPITVTLTEAGRRVAASFAMPDVHGATMAPIAIASLAAAALAATAISLAATAVVFDATRWATYTAANILLALTHVLIGALLAPIFGRVGGHSWPS
jgi:hypothetical protein